MRFSYINQIAVLKIFKINSTEINKVLKLRVFNNSISNFVSIYTYIYLHNLLLLSLIYYTYIWKVIKTVHWDFYALYNSYSKLKLHIYRISILLYDIYFIVFFSVAFFSYFVSLWHFTLLILSFRSIYVQKWSLLAWYFDII